MPNIKASVFCSLLFFLGGCAKKAVVPQVNNWAEIQTAISSSPIVLDEGRIRSLIPYSSISFERTMCFGPCPIYVVTFNKNGKARLVEDHMSDKPTYFNGRIDLREYARLAQLVESARAHSKWTEYSGQWTDDYSAKITARTPERSWSVSDYGQVAPPEVWALEQVLHQLRESTEWTPVAIK